MAEKLARVLKKTAAFITTATGTPATTSRSCSIKGQPVYELERFKRADEKAAKHSTAFVFLLGIIGHFDKWIFGLLQLPDFPVGFPN